jgi:hypothetical protein
MCLTILDKEDTLTHLITTLLIGLWCVNMKCTMLNPDRPPIPSNNLLLNKQSTQHIAQSVSIEHLDKDGFFPKDTRDIGDAFTDTVEGKDALGITITSHEVKDSPDDSQPGAGTQISMLFNREIRNLKRDTMALGARLGLTTFLSLLVGVIFLDVGAADSNKPQNQQSQFGALVMIMMMGMFGTGEHR